MDVRELPAVQQVEACRRLITELEQGIARARQAAGRAARVRDDAALEAARGNGSARQLLQEATSTTAEAELKAENLGMALSAARERLAQLERQAEAERLDGIRRRGMEAARVRRAAAERLQAAIEALVEAHGAFRATDEVISAVRGEPDGHRLIPIDWHAAGCAFANAVPAGLRTALRMPYLTGTPVRVPEADPVCRWLADQEAADRPEPLAPAQL